ncbi:MAG: alpha/beta hydrolase [Actinomycetota bacterium]|nr:alpha/beta hydrolase [Actinomycetota bacterium]
MRHWALGLGLLMFLAVGVVADSPPSTAPRVVDVAYGEDPMQRLDVYPALAPSPAVVLVHGGGWTRGDKDLPEIRESSLRLQKRGFAVFSINYRLADADRPGEPMQTQDVTSAIDWVLANGARYGADDSGIRLVGGSSGAQLVSLAGQQINADRPGLIRGVVAMSGPMDFVRVVEQNLPLEPEDRTGKSIPVYLGCRLAECTPDQLRGPSPIYNIAPTSPPFLIVNSDDEIVPLEQAQAMHDALTAAGRTSTLRVVPGQGHGLSLLEAAEDGIVRFLRA